MWQPNNRQWWFLVAVSLLIVCAWPPVGGRSMATKFVNWAVDPLGTLPVLPRPLGLGDGDDPEKALAYDRQSQAYYLLHLEGGWTRKRLELKVAADPFDPGTQRQALTAIGVIAVLTAWRLSRHQK